MIGMVTQDTSLLHRSVRDNILYGRPDATEADMCGRGQARRGARLHPRPDRPIGRSGYDAHVGERGVKLSGGQRQRIAIARVMLKDAPILLLDEATSALDSEVEAAIQASLYRLMEGKTVVAIAHRLSTIAAMDRLVVLDQGRIVEMGDHRSLLAQGGLYARLWAHQSGGFLVDDERGPCGVQRTAGRRSPGRPRDAGAAGLPLGPARHYLNLMRVASRPLRLAANCASTSTLRPTRMSASVPSSSRRSRTQLTVVPRSLKVLAVAVHRFDRAAQGEAVFQLVVAFDAQLAGLEHAAAHRAANLDARAFAQARAAFREARRRPIHPQAVDAELRGRDEAADPAIELGLVAVVGRAHAAAEGGDHPAAKGSDHLAHGDTNDVAYRQAGRPIEGTAVVEAEAADAQALPRGVERRDRAAQVTGGSGIAQLDARGTEKFVSDCCTGRQGHCRNASKCAVGHAA